MVLPQKYLDIEVPKSDNQKATEAIIGCNITAKRNMLQDAFGNSTKMKIPKCMLDQFALIKSHSGIVNSEPNLKRMKNQVIMAKSLGEIEEAERQLKVSKRTAAEEILKAKAPMALEKLSKKKGDIDKLYKGEM